MEALNCQITIKTSGLTLSSKKPSEHVTHITIPELPKSDISSYAGIRSRIGTSFSLRFSSFAEHAGGKEEKAIVAKNATTASDSKTYKIDFYNLDVVVFC